MIVCDLLCAAVFLVIAAVGPGYVALLVLVFVAESAATVALPASRTMIGRVVPDEHRTAANGLLLAAVSVGFAGGAALGGLAAAAWDYRWALAANAVSFVIAAGLLTRMPPAAPAPRTERVGLLAGLSALRTDRWVAAVTIGVVGVAFAPSVDRPALIALVEQDLDSSGLGYGLALGGIALGGLAVSLAALRSKALDDRAMVVFCLGVLTQAVGHLGLGLSPVVAVLVVAAVVAGVGNGMETVCGITLLQRGAPAASLGMLMGVVLSGSFLANALGSLVGGALVDLLGPRWTFVVAAAIMAAAAIPVLLRVARNRHR